MVNSFHIFSSFSRLTPNLSKCEIAGIGVLKGVKVAVCGIQCVDLVLDAIKILEKVKRGDKFLFDHS